ncbi:hypothetical protein N1030_14225 [Desulfovibrio mangrovi]|uniref:hypothetical protein n=1 Tax=Desulfovibrio mangrovi TaxID=2976983 RepID=UPI002245A0CC|nr:hypothetical protein [Desulfovibrio mangrovi]UZP66757.1 hypothetical protein N1030_14225 [Desulfovibrio mangrovi]
MSALVGFHAKTVQPAVDMELLLPRHALLESVMPTRGKGGRLLVEARAGQGKTTFALQYLQAVGGRSLWYQCGTEDADLVCMVAALVEGLRRTLPGFACPDVEGGLKEGGAGFDDLSWVARALVAGVERTRAGLLHFVFDDVHLLEGAPQALVLLRELLFAAGQSIGIVFLSRRPCMLDGVPLFPQGVVEHVRNARLAFTLPETAELLTGILAAPATASTLSRLHAMTEGWPMGIVMSREMLSAGGELAEDIPHGMEDDLACHLHEAYLESLSVQEREVLLRLALLNSVTEGKADIAAPGMHAMQTLGKLTQFGGFVRKSGDRYGFHHLFRSCLSSMAWNVLGENVCKGVLVRVAEWCAANGEEEEAFEYLVEAGDVRGAAKLLGRYGLSLVENNRLATLGKALERLSPDVVEADPWLSCYQGITLLNVAPDTAMEILGRALAMFEARNDHVGELHVIVHQILYQLVVSGYDSRAPEYVRHAEEILASMSDLPAHFVFHIEKALVTWRIFYLEEQESVREKLDHIFQYARMNDLHNAITETAMMNCIRLSLCSKFSTACDVLETAYDMLPSPRLSVFLRAAVHLTLINLHAMTGDRFNYARTRCYLDAPGIREVAEKTSLGAFRELFDIDSALAEGNLSLAAERVSRLEGGLANGNAHLLSQCLHYKALVLSLAGDREGVATAAEACLLQRSLVPRPYFVRLSRMFLGGAFAQVGDVQQAEELLCGVIEEYVRIGETHCRSAALFHLAALRLRIGSGDALETVRQAVVCLKDAGHEHFFSWLPQVDEAVLSAAVVNGIEPDFCYKLGVRRLDKALLADGRVLPVLCVQSFGGFRIRCGEKVLEDGDFTSAQRELLALLVVSGGSVSQERVQEFLWPDRSREMARSAFDTLLSRTRKALADGFGKDLSREYLVLQKGVLALRHARLDTVAYDEALLQGDRLYVEGRRWQAGCAYALAEHLWAGELFPAVQGPDVLHEQRELGTARFVAMAPRLSELLVHEGAHVEGVRVLEKARRSDMTNTAVVRSLHDLYCKAAEPVRAARVVREMRQALTDEGYSRTEIDEIMDAFWSVQKP